MTDPNDMTKNLRMADNGFDNPAKYDPRTNVEMADLMVSAAETVFTLHRNGLLAEFLVAAAARLRSLASDLAAAKLTNTSILIGLRWDGDGYSWEPTHGDYREPVADAAERARQYVADLEAKLAAATGAREAAERRAGELANLADQANIALAVAEDVLETLGFAEGDATQGGVALKLSRSVQSRLDEALATPPANGGHEVPPVEDWAENGR